MDLGPGQILFTFHTAMAVFGESSFNFNRVGLEQVADKESIVAGTIDRILSHSGMENSFLFENLSRPQNEKPKLLSGGISKQIVAFDM
jgi:hypothetical protein